MFVNEKKKNQQKLIKQLAENMKITEEAAEKEFLRLSQKKRRKLLEVIANQ